MIRKRPPDVPEAPRTPEDRARAVLADPNCTPLWRLRANIFLSSNGTWARWFDRDEDMP